MLKLGNIINYEKEKANSYLILLSSTVLLPLWWYCFRAESIMNYISNLKLFYLGRHYAVIYQFLSFFIIMMVIPLVFIIVNKNYKISNFGLKPGDLKFGLKFLAIALPISTIITYISSQSPAIQKVYPISDIIVTEHDLIIWYELSYIFFFYAAWEFYFRGFLLFGLKESLGNISAILIQTLASTLIHLGQPGSEVFAAFIGGIIFGIITLRANSFWYAFVIHAYIGVTDDLFIILNNM